MSVQPGVVVSYYSPELCLEHLLRRCFSVPDLRMMLFRLPDQGDLKDHLPVMEGATPASYARQAVLVLVARSLVGRPLFEAIAAERSCAWRSRPSSKRSSCTSRYFHAGWKPM